MKRWSKIRPRRDVEDDRLRRVHQNELDGLDAWTLRRRFERTYLSAT
jgi:hypothetical protein